MLFIAIISLLFGNNLYQQFTSSPSNTFIIGDPTFGQLPSNKNPDSPYIYTITTIVPSTGGKISDRANGKDF